MKRTLYPDSRLVQWRLIFALLLLLFQAARAEKTDVVVLKNGDRVTGEVKRLEAGILVFKTDDMGTINIEWEKIARLEAKETFEVELEWGKIHFGQLRPSSFREFLLIVNDTATVELYRPFIVRITPIKDTFWARIDASVNFGSSFTKASKVTQLNFGGDAAYRGWKYASHITHSSILTAQPDKATSRRHDFSANWKRFLRWRWFSGGLIGLQQNSELGINLRLSLGLGAGRDFIKTNEHQIFAFGGLMVNREWVQGSDPNQFNLEALTTLDWKTFRYEEPKRDISTRLNIFPNLTTLGRVRLEFDSRVNWEIITDFFLNLTLYASYDNKPPSAEAAKDDYGIVISFSWKIL